MTTPWSGAIKAAPVLKHRFFWHGHVDLVNAVEASPEASSVKVKTAEASPEASPAKRLRCQHHPSVYRTYKGKRYCRVCKNKAQRDRRQRSR